MKSPLLAIRQIVRLTDRIFWLAYDDHYAMSMTWLRVAEFRESPEDQFKTGHFRILDFMDWYAKNKGRGVFSYPTDWMGYNLHSNWLHKMYVELKDKIPDWNEYDTAADAIRRYATDACGEDWALCSTMAGKLSVLNHEIAHSLWATDKPYENAQKAAIAAAPIETVQVLRANLARMGYGSEVLDDELQAYLATGLYAEITKGCSRPEVAALRKGIKENFRPYYEAILPHIPRSLG